MFNMLFLHANDGSVEKIFHSRAFRNVIDNDKELTFGIMYFINLYDVHNEYIDHLNKNFAMIQNVRPELSWFNSSFKKELLEDEVYKQILAGKLQINEGMLYENAIAQMLVANGHKLYFYTHYNENKHRNDMEIDFIISNNSRLKYKMFPIEVKSGKQYKTTSLNNFREKYKERIGESYIIHPRNLIVKDGIICIPPYMTMNI